MKPFEVDPAKKTVREVEPYAPPVPRIPAPPAPIPGTYGKNYPKLPTPTNPNKDRRGSQDVVPDESIDCSSVFEDDDEDD